MSKHIIQSNTSSFNLTNMRNNHIIKSKTNFIIENQKNSITRSLRKGLQSRNQTRLQEGEFDGVMVASAPWSSRTSSPLKVETHGL